MRFVTPRDGRARVGRMRLLYGAIWLPHATGETLLQKPEGAKRLTTVAHRVEEKAVSERRCCGDPGQP